jgi:hypothetical protein
MTEMSWRRLISFPGSINRIFFCALFPRIQDPSALLEPPVRDRSRVAIRARPVIALPFSEDNQSFSFCSSIRVPSWFQVLHTHG